MRKYKTMSELLKNVGSIRPFNKIITDRGISSLEEYMRNIFAYMPDFNIDLLEIKYDSNVLKKRILIPSERNDIKLVSFYYDSKIIDTILCEDFIEAKIYCGNINKYKDKYKQFPDGDPRRENFIKSSNSQKIGENTLVEILYLM